MEQYSAFQAKNKLSELLDLVERGEEIVITRRGKPLARLVPHIRAYDQERAALARIRERTGSHRSEPFDWEEFKSLGL